MTTECPVCRDAIPEGAPECPRCKGRRLVGELLALVPETWLQGLSPRLAYVQGIVREALYADALARAEGSRRKAGELLHLAEQRVTEATREYPWLRRAFPKPRGRVPRKRPTSE